MVLGGTTTRTRTDLLVIGGYLLAAVLLYSRMWTDLGHGYLRDSRQDQNMFEWFFAVAAHAPRDALFSTLQNHPSGVNMMANTSMLGLGIPLAPVTLLFGPTVTWTLVLTGGVAGNAAGWYWLISRHVTESRAAAAIGGAFCAFAPPMISHANAHPNFTAMFVLPFIVARLAKLSRDPVRHGVVLGFLVAYQVFLGEEPLFIAATALLIYACARRSVLTRNLFKGLAVAALVALPLVAYPIWKQFAGPQSYWAMGHGGAGNNLTAMTTYASQSLAGDPVVAGQFAANVTEENAFFGWPLVILVVVLAIWLWRVAAARALVITAAAMAVLSLGSHLTVKGVDTGVPLPWLVVSRLPLFDSLLGSRLAMACVPAIGILLAMASERILTLARHTAHIPLRLLWIGTLTAVLLPIAPLPMSVIERADTPSFFVDGTWREYVEPGRSIVTVPVASGGYALPLHWQTDADLGFPLAEGYFVGPGEGGKGHYGAVQRPTTQLLDKVAQTGHVPPIGPDERDRAFDDVRFWQAGAVVLGPHPRQGELYAACEALFGPGRYVRGVWVWRM
jgi:hypothetical protein